MGKIKVLIVDDSPTTRALLRRVLGGEEEIEVVGEASDGYGAIKKIVELDPKVVLLDLNMPKMDGLQVIEYVMKRKPVSILVVSGALNKGGRFTTISALSRGALDVIKKPEINSREDIEKFKNSLVKKIKILSQIKPLHHIYPGKIGGKGVLNIKKEIKVVGIGSSTGGPRLLARIFESLTNPLPYSILVVQHIPHPFDLGLVEWISSITQLRVKLARDGEEVLPSTVYIAPHGHHMTVNEEKRIFLEDGPPYKGQKPSIDIMFNSLARLEEGVMGILLSGMGDDGADGLLKIKKAGGITIALREEDCAVFGMSKAAIEKGAVEKGSSLEEIIETLRRFSNAGPP